MEIEVELDLGDLGFVRADVSSEVYYNETNDPQPTIKKVAVQIGGTKINVLDKLNYHVLDDINEEIVEAHRGELKANQSGRWE